jgi:hypothetical protein
VAYTETGEMLVFKGSPATKPGDAVASAVRPDSGVDSHAPPTWSPTYLVEEVIALHITGVAMFSADERGTIKDGRDLDPELLVVLERLLERARWLGGEMVSKPYHDKTVCLTWGEDIHMAAIVDGEPDERLDRELRWAIGDLADTYADEIWSWGEETDSSVARALTARLADVFNLTANITPGKLAARSTGGGLRVTSTISWRHSLVEFTLGIVNDGPGAVFDIELHPSLNKEGIMDVVTVLGIEVDKDMKFRVEEIPEGKKTLATFVFRILDPAAVKIDCTIIYLRGVANIQELRLPGRWVELERVELVHGETVEPERALELATQPAAFRDRAAFVIPPSISPELLFNKAIESLKEDMDPVVELEDDDKTQLEAWFHAQLVGGDVVVASITVVPPKGIVDIFAASTVAGVVPGCMVHLRKALERALHQRINEVLDEDLMSTVPKMGVLLVESWGAFFEN